MKGNETAFNMEIYSFDSSILNKMEDVYKRQDFCSVTGGTTIVSDWLKIRITSDPGHSFLDRMIALVEGASRKKTPNEIALNTLLVSLTIIFMIVIVTLYPIGIYSGVTLPTSTLIALAEMCIRDRYRRVGA